LHTLDLRVVIWLVDRTKAVACVSVFNPLSDVTGEV
jgi:hypothetical protein